jgi:hypothetical protein
MVKKLNERVISTFKYLKTLEITKKQLRGVPEPHEQQELLGRKEHI